MGSPSRVESHVKDEDVNHLFIFPAECNFSGTRMDLKTCERWRNGEAWPAEKKEEFGTGKWRVCIDAAKYCSTKRLDLSAVKPDFVTISFYKLFG